VFTVALIHPWADLVPLLTEVAHEVMADAELIHMVDEGIPRLVAEAGGITEPATRRLCGYAMNAHEAKADAVMLTSPVFGPALDAVRSVVGIPVVRIDAAMVESAVQFGTNVGVLATSPLTLEPTLALLLERADAKGKDVALDSRVSEEAGAALARQDREAYERIVSEEAAQLAGNDCVVLADVMMHRALRAASERVRVPVLASPQLGFEDLAKKLDYFRR